MRSSSEQLTTDGRACVFPTRLADAYGGQKVRQDAFAYLTMVQAPFHAGVKTD